ncbi:MAG TPA: MASE1 domain-containing protein [Pyrinomonadaceae bacterium]|nr:MASE1 domain-containing protein [Pyrinomonadaceae bacterium]
MIPQSIPIARQPFGDRAFRTALLTAIIVFVTYYLTAKIGFEFALQPGSVSTLWMPNSLLLAALLMIERRWWWLIVAAALPAHLASEFQSGVPATMVFCWFVSNSVQALLAAFCITYFIKEGTVYFERIRDLSLFLLFGAFLAPFAASFLDSALVQLNNWDHRPYWEIWRVRFLSNVLASLTLIPFVLVWFRGGLGIILNAPLRRYLEAALLAAGFLVVALYVFNTQRGFAEKTPSLLYWPLPFLLWSTVRFGLRGVTTSLVFIMFVAIDGATRGAGPFVTSSALDNAMSIQMFLIVVSIPLMVLASIIEERRKVEAAARENEERLMLALNAAQMETWDWRITDNRLIWPDETRNGFGVKSKEDISPETFFRLVHPEDREKVERATSSAVREGVPYEIEYRMLADGETRWFLSKGTVLRDELGRPARMLGIGIDITERKTAEEALEKINDRNQAILRAVPDMMFLLTRDGVYLDYSAREVDKLLVPPSDFIGKSIKEVMPRDLAESFIKILSELSATDEPYVVEYTLPMNGETKFFEARLILAEGENVLTIVRDVTEAHQAIDSARESQEKVLQSNKQIRALAARLISAQESERRRISLLLHDDVSQNVAALGLSISRLKRKLPTSNDELLDELGQLGSQAYDLTTQIRRLSHQLHPEVLEHLGLVKALESHVTEFGYEEHIETSFKADVRSEPLPIDLSVCLYRVALEGLRNISRHSGAKSAEVILRETNGCLMLQVSDSGFGFDVERARRGNGIGLASSEERIRLLQGSFEIHSSPETGTIMTARVPLMR